MWASTSNAGGLTFQRPDKRAVEQDPQAVRVWHEESRPAIRAQAKEGAAVCRALPVRLSS
ncbi:winged helix-turn-helix domain-containing protein [Streptomyces hirsutus]